jgi:DNA topoisomerase VI subunit A
LPKAKAASDPVVGRIVDSGREIHSRIVGGRKRAKALQPLLKMGVRAEQQAFAKFDLNFVIDRHLPEKLKQPGKFLP